VGVVRMFGILGRECAVAFGAWLYLFWYFFCREPYQRLPPFPPVPFMRETDTRRIREMVSPAWGSSRIVDEAQERLNP
jgi:hypothetical protein